MLVKVDEKFTQGEYLNFLDIGKPDSYKAKTRVFSVTSHTTHADLGVIKWYSHWRKYTYQPPASIILDAKCMREIADFCELKTNERKEKWDYSKEKGPQFVAKLIPRKGRNELQISSETDCEEVRNEACRSDSGVVNP